MKKNFTFYLIGICGISMSSLALFLKKLGFNVEGSDISFNENYPLLRESKIKVYNVHDNKNIKNNYVVIYNSAIKNTNQELNYALKNNLVFSRVDFISLITQFFNVSIGISGCHGKTTTSCMLLNILYNQRIYANIGGLDSNLNNSYFSGNDILLTEVCEYNKNINFFKNDISVVLNIDLDHLECYKNITDLINSYYKYLDRAKYKIVNIDDKYLKKYKSDNLITFSIKNNATFNSKNIKMKNGYISFDLYKRKKYITNVTFKSICKHNIYNVLACFCVCDCLKMDINIVKNGLLKFNGVKRRCEFLGEINSNKIYTDYAHHPKEIYSTLSSFKKEFKNENIIAVFQPHTFSRTKLLFNDFKKILSGFSVIIYKTYPARETENLGYSGKFLAESLGVEYLDTEEGIRDLIKNSHKKTIIFIGAGDIYLIVKKIISSY